MSNVALSDSKGSANIQTHPKHSHAQITTKYNDDAQAKRFLLETNYRKKFFRLPLERVKSFATTEGIHAAFTLVAGAHEYRETLALEKMTPKEREKYHLHRANGDDLVAD